MATPASADVVYYEGRLSVDGVAFAGTGRFKFALVGEEVIIEPEGVEAGPFRGHAGVAKGRPVGPLDPVGGAESHRRIVGR